MDKQLHEAEKQREKINKDMGNFRQDIDTQKVPTKVLWIDVLMAYSRSSAFFVLDLHHIL